MLTSSQEQRDLIREIVKDAKYDERDDIVDYLRLLSRCIQAEAMKCRWWSPRRSLILAGAAAVGMAAEHVAHRHRRQDV